MSYYKGYYKDVMDRLKEIFEEYKGVRFNIDKLQELKHEILIVGFDSVDIEIDENRKPKLVLTNLNEERRLEVEFTKGKVKEFNIVRFDDIFSNIRIV